MKIAEKILLFFSRDPLTEDYGQDQQPQSLDKVLGNLTALFPDLSKNISDKRLIDYGCGEGYQAIALAMNGARHVLGVDINPKALSKGRELSREYNLEHKLQFVDTIENVNNELYDYVISINSMEHYTDPIRVLELMKSSIKNEGHIFVSFGPPWYSPYGSHMHFFTKLPWLNIIFSEKTVMRVRSHFRDDGATKYEEVESGLNRMSIKKFESIISDSGLKPIYSQYSCIKSLNMLGKIPFLRELFINRVTCILSK